MHIQRLTSSSIIVFAVACRLALGGFASPTLAKNMIVTTLTDTADPPFNTVVVQSDSPDEAVQNPGEKMLRQRREHLL